METPSPTRGQLERTLSQRIQALYRTQLGHQPSKVSCQIFDEKIAIIVEDSVTKPEQLLVQQGREELAEQVRADLDEVIQQQLKVLIEEIVGVSVIDLLSDAKLDTGRTGTIAVLAETPKIRNPG
ncbi:MAG: hypothetical protein NVS2B14_16210 [Chamaesiphon sp.]